LHVWEKYFLSETNYGKPQIFVQSNIFASYGKQLVFKPKFLANCLTQLSYVISWKA